MELQLAGKVALVTGSSRGLGFSIAQALYDEGCYVVLNSRNSIDLKVATKALGDKATAVAGDVTNEQEARQVVTNAKVFKGKIDLVVCNVGSGRSLPPAETNLEEWLRVFNINLFSATNIVKAAESSLAEVSGNIVCISSICGINAIDAPITYSSAKAALNAFVKSSSRYLAKSNIRINAIAPGNLLFPGSKWDKKLKENSKEVKKLISKEVSMGRLGRPEEIASFVCFLASIKASFCTGAVYIVDGGQVR